jgi:hypothetical protein
MDFPRCGQVRDAAPAARAPEDQRIIRSVRFNDCPALLGKPHSDAESMKDRETYNPPDDSDRRRKWIADHLGRGKAFRRLKDAERKALVGSLSRIIDYWIDTADRELAPDELLDAVDFPDFVSGLVQGVFDAIVDASIDQMEAYQDLLRSVAQTVDQFTEESVTDDQAIDYLTTTLPDVFARANRNGHTVERRRGATKERWVLALALLGLSEATRKLKTDALSERLVQATRRHLVRERQQLLATMVLMGIQRIVDPDEPYRRRLKLRPRYRRKKKS